LRLRVQFQVNRVPLCYRNVFMSYVKEILQATPSGEQQFIPLFHFDENHHNKAPKPYCFAVRFIHDRESFLKDGDCFTLKSPLAFYFSTSDMELLVDFYNGVIDRSIYPFSKGDFILPYPMSIIPIKDRPITQETVLFQTLSPVLIEDSAGKPLLPTSQSQQFLEELNYYANALLRGVRGEGLQKKLDFQPVSIRKEVVKHAIREREETSRVYTFTCFSGRFILQGDPGDLNDIQVLGIGRRRSQGFGMLEVV